MIKIQIFARREINRPHRRDSQKTFHCVSACRMLAVAEGTNRAKMDMNTACDWVLSYCQLQMEKVNVCTTVQAETSTPTLSIQYMLIYCV